MDEQCKTCFRLAQSSPCYEQTRLTGCSGSGVFKRGDDELDVWSENQVERSAEIGGEVVEERSLSMEG